MKKAKEYGFTMAEMLIVVAIILILVSVSIPVFSGQLTKAQLAAETANLRSAYAEAVAAELLKAQPNEAGKIAVSLTPVFLYTGTSASVDEGMVVVTLNGQDETFSIDSNVALTITDSPPSEDES